MSITDIIKSSLEESASVNSIVSLDKEIILALSEASKLLIETFSKEGKILLAGNGGSAADCQHMAGEYVSRFLIDRNGLPAIALTTDTSIITAIGNDYGYEMVFSRQIEAVGKKGDLLFVYSTSGNSQNILKAVETAKRMEISVVGMTGLNRGKMDTMCDFIFKTPSIHTPQIQEGHLIAGHAICALVEKQFFQTTRHN